MHHARLYYKYFLHYTRTTSYYSRTNRISDREHVEYNPDRTFHLIYSRPLLIHAETLRCLYGVPWVPWVIQT